MKTTVLAFLLGASSAAAQCLTPVSADISAALQYMATVPGDMEDDPSQIPTQLSQADQAIGNAGTAAENCILSLDDQETLSTNYGQLQPAILSATNAMAADPATLNQYNTDGAISNQLTSLMGTLNSTSSDLAAIAPSEASAINQVAAASNEEIEKVIQLML